MSRLSLVRGTPIKAEFVTRPNRFVAKCCLKDGSVVDAFMPNPGRLGELLLPGARMILEETSFHANRRTRFTVAAVYRQDMLIGLNTLKANSIVSHLIKHQMVPGLEEIRTVSSEVAHGRSRFDFLVENETGMRFFLEVKSVTLCGNGIAMFPDAVTARGSRHLLELAKLSEPGAKSVVLFLVQGKGQEMFVPDYHTDLDFARIMFQVRNSVKYVPAAIDWDMELKLKDSVDVLNIPWHFISKRLADTGAYLLTLRIDRCSKINIGALGGLEIRCGYYIYVGSGMSNLSTRIARHLRRRKKLRWHIDYLCDVADRIQAFPVRSPWAIETEIATEVARLYEPCLPGFGSSDSPLSTHLFFSETNPVAHEAFQSLLQQFRFVRP